MSRRSTTQRTKQSDVDKTRITQTAKAATTSKRPNVGVPSNKTKDDAEQRKTSNKSETSKTKVSPATKADSKTAPLPARSTGVLKKKPVAAVSRSSNVSKSTNPPRKTNAVLDTFHNVTVTSPKLKRKDPAPKIETLRENFVRKRSRTLEPEEVVVLKRESAKKRIEQEILDSTERDNVELAQKSQLKEPVAFEVSLRDVPAKPVNNSKVQQDVQPNEDSGPENYSDDFESYESDFESSSSQSNQITSDDEKSAGTEEEEDSNSSNHDDSNCSHDEDNEMSDSESDQKELELTLDPAVSQRSKECKLDSGSYEMNSRKHLSETSSQPGLPLPFTSLDPLNGTTASEQLDSGISTNGVLMPLPRSLGEQEYENIESVSYGGYKNFFSKPVVNQRGRDLLAKIEFDSLNYTLLDMQPIGYDIFMRTYGQLNTTQSSTQTQDNRTSADCQTNQSELRTMWTQHPPQHDLQTVQRCRSNGFTYNSTNCFGEEEPEVSHTQGALNTDELDESLFILRRFQQKDKHAAEQRQLRQLPKPIDFERLNNFLLNSSKLMLKLLNSANSAYKTQSKEASEFSVFSQGYSLLDTNILNALKVVRVFGNCEHNMVVTVHESPPESQVYRSDFSQLLMVWSTQQCNKPIRLLSTWSEVCHAEISHEAADVLVCGLSDGSVAMWDLREAYTYCSKLDGSLQHFAATQSVVPHWGPDKEALNRTEDLGAVVDVKAFKKSKNKNLTDYKLIQFVSLHETGLLVVWTLVETPSNSVPQAKAARSPVPSAVDSTTLLEYHSPKGRVKLIQSSICSVRDYLEKRMLKAHSNFDSTKTLFEKNIYQDGVLRELNGNQSPLKQQQGLQGIRFTSIATGVELVYVCTNQNFLICCTKGLKPDRFRRLIIEENRFLFPTAICVLSNENFLAVGLSNGSVMIVNSNLQSSHSARGTKGEMCPLQSAQDIEGISAAASPNEPEETRKSCAIQNIILNERRTSSQSQQSVEFLRPSTAACVTMLNNQKPPFELRVYDHQVILSGSVLRKDLVQSLELSSDGSRLFILSNGFIRVYDFHLDRELQIKPPESGYKVLDLVAAKGRHSESLVVMLNSYNDVEVHLLKQ